MAFVCRSERTFQAKETGTAPEIGPGTYIRHVSYRKPVSYAPFASTVIRDDEPTHNARAPPPGTYDPKLPGGPYESGLPKKYVPFKSTESRFRAHKQSEKSDDPGPGDYEMKGLGDIRLENCRTMGLPPEQKASLRALSAPSIPARAQSYGYEQSNNGKLVRQRGPQDYVSGRNNDCVGPDHYYVDDVYTKKRVTGGMMCITPRAVGTKNYNPGPGHYDKEIKSKNARPNAAFRSTVGRGLKESTKDVMPGPGQYDLGSAINAEMVEPSYQFFGSTVERFNKKKPEGVPGPGSYKTSKDISDISTGKLASTASRWRGSRTSLRQPGPGQYETTEGFGIDAEKSMNTQKTFSVLGNQGALAFGAMSTRFVKSARQARDPGPGAYEQSDHEERKARTQPSSFFRSKVAKDGTKQIIERLNEDNAGPPPGAYNPRPVQETAEVVRIQPKHEGFGSAGVRFAANQSEEPIGPGSYNPRHPNSRKEFNRSMGMNRNGVPIGFSTCSSRFDQPQKRAKDAPGPGDYNVEGNLVSKTYNTLFGEVS